MEIAEEKKPNFKVFWSEEEVSDRFLVQYYSQMINQIAKENKLLGKFENEKYTINQEIKSALVKIKKKIDDKKDNTYYVISKLPDRLFTFKMKIFEVDNGNMLAASLYLIELVDNDLFEKPLKTFIAQYIDKNNDEFIHKAKYAFNISIEGEFNEFEKAENKELFAIDVKIKALNKEANERISKIFILDMLRQFETCNESGKKIIEEFKSKNPNLEDENVSFIELKKSFDTIVEKNGGYKKLIEENTGMKTVIQTYVAQVEQEFVTPAFIEIEREHKEEKVEEKKEVKAPSKTSGSKSSSKGGGGKGGKNAGGKGGGGKGGKSGGGKGGGDKKPQKKDDKTPATPYTFDLNYKSIFGAKKPEEKKTVPKEASKKEGKKENKKPQEDLKQEPKPVIKKPEVVVPIEEKDDSAFLLKSMFSGRDEKKDLEENVINQREIQMDEEAKEEKQKVEVNEPIVVIAIEEKVEERLVKPKEIKKKEEIRTI